MKSSDISKKRKKRIFSAYSSGLSRGVCLILIFTLLFSVALSLSSCGSGEPQKRTYYEFFDTVCTVSYYGGEGTEYFEDAISLIEGELEKYHRLFDAYNPYSETNNLYTVNSLAGVSPVRVDPSLFALISYGKEVYSLTDGEVNIAFGAVTALWKRASTAAEAGSDLPLPSAAELSEASKHTSIELIKLDEKNSTVYISDPLASIDVGAVGKGFAAERIAELLAERGFDSFVLDLGGNIRAVGTKPDGSGWITGIEDPQGDTEHPFAARVELLDSSCVTSGDYKRYFTVDGNKYHHIIDKDTLYPAEHYSSVTVIVPDSALADALSTALFCMPLEEGKALIERTEGAKALWIYADGRKVFSSDFDRLS